jgi:predicted GH43/DUF377 family glycosyl hydrolase
MNSAFTTLALTLLLLTAIVTTSSAQLSWTKDPNNPVMSGGADGQWNRNVFGPMILENQDSTGYEMWFTAAQINYTYPNRIGFATSPDGITWTMLDTAVLEPDPGTWEQTTVEFPMVLRDNGHYNMWYTGWNVGPPLSIGYATSSDGISWTKDALNNPVIGSGTESWEAGGTSYCSVLPDPGGGYKMWYTGFNSQGDYPAIGYAESVDGIIWQRPLSNPVLITGSSGEWDDRLVALPRVLYHGGIYYMLYTGGTSWDDPPWHIGLAASTDGIVWTKYNYSTTTNHPYAESDPVLSPSQGQWDGDFIEAGTVMLIGDTVHMWYDGFVKPSPPNPTYIGHAIMPLNSLIEWGVTVGIEEFDNSIIPEGYSLDQNYPNPFNPSTTIEFSLPKSEFVELKVYNILGKKAATLVANKLNQGNHTYTFDGKNLASGIYYYQLTAGDYREVKKMIILK